MSEGGGEGWEREVVRVLGLREGGGEGWEREVVRGGRGRW